MFVFNVVSSACILQLGKVVNAFSMALNFSRNKTLKIKHIQKRSSRNKISESGLKNLKKQEYHKQQKQEL